MRRVRVLLPLFTLFFTAACASGGNDGPTPTTPPFTSEVTVTQPQPGTVVYAETLRVVGTVTGDSAQSLVVELQSVGEALAQATIDALPGDWSLELPHNYSGEPAVLELIVRPAGDADGEYTRLPLTVADVTHRPEGAFATIFMPEGGTTLGGDVIPVEGTASGMESLQVVLLDTAGAVLDQQTIMLHNPFLIDEVPWQTALAPGAYTGAASIELRYNDGVEAAPASVEITLDLTAG